MKSARPRPGRQAAQGEVPFRGDCYLYGIVRPADAKLCDSLGGGVGDPPRPAVAVIHRDIAALVSQVDAGQISSDNVRAMRRDMKAHSAMLLRAAADTTVLPARYGLVFPGPDVLIAQMLQPQYAAIDAHLRRLDGAVEITLRATYIEPRILGEVVARNPSLAARKGSRGYSDRIDVGKRISAAIQDLREQDGRDLVHAIAPAVRDVRLGDLPSDLMLLNASFLVDRKKVPQFDKRLAALNEQLGHRMTFDCVGPLPPYTFVDLRVA